MKNKIFVKNSETSSFDCLTPLEMRQRLQKLSSSIREPEGKSSAIIGVMQNGEFLSHYIFTIHDGNQKLCRYFIRKLEHVGTKKTCEYNHVDRSYLTFNNNELWPTPYDGGDSRPALPATGYFSDDGITLIKNELFKGQFSTKKSLQIILPMKYSALSKEQQEALYTGYVSLAQNSSFAEILDSILSGLTEAQQVKVLQRIITNPNESSKSYENDVEVLTSIDQILYEFLSPDRVNRFSKKLYEKSGSYHPTIGDVVDFYIDCVQTILSARGLANCVPDIQLRQMDKEIRQLELGNNIYQFKKDDIYNSQGLQGEDAIIFEFLENIFGFKGGNISRLSEKFDFVGAANKLVKVLQDILDIIKHHPMTQLTKHPKLYNKLQSIYPVEGWSQKLGELQYVQRMLQHMVYKITPVREYVLNYQRATTSQKQSVLNFFDISLEDDTPKGAHYAESAISLCLAGLLTMDNFKLVEMHQEPYYIADALNTLSQEGMLVQFNFNAVVHHQHPQDLAYALKIMQQNNLLTQCNFYAVAKCKYHPQTSLISDWGLASALRIMQKNKLLTQSNFNLFIAVSNRSEGIWKLADALNTVDQANLLLMPKYYYAVVNSKYPQGLASVLNTLQENDILEPDSLNDIAVLQRLDTLGYALNILNKAGLLTLKTRDVAVKLYMSNLWVTMLERLYKKAFLTPVNFNLISKHTCLNELKNMLFILECNNLLTLDNFKAVASHQSIKDLRELIEETTKLSMFFMQKNFYAIVKHQNPQDLAIALKILKRGNQLTQNTFNMIVSHQNPKFLANKFLEFCNKNRPSFFIPSPIDVEFVKSVYEAQAGNCCPTDVRWLFFRCNTYVKAINVLEKKLQDIRGRGDAKSEIENSAPYKSLEVLGITTY